MVRDMELAIVAIVLAVGIILERTRAPSRVRVHVRDDRR
jgi:hypothetical protein